MFACLSEATAAYPSLPAWLQSLPLRLFNWGRDALLASPQHRHHLTELQQVQYFE